MTSLLKNQLQSFHTDHSDSETSSYLPSLVTVGGTIAPGAPYTLDKIGIDKQVLMDLLLKTIFTIPHFEARWVASRLCLPLVIINELLEQLRVSKLIEALGHQEHSGHRYSISSRGRERATYLLDISGYIGPAPVSFEAYATFLQWQYSRLPLVNREKVHQTLKNMVLSEDAIEIAGLALSSSRSLFLSGGAGNGKTTLGRKLHDAMEGEFWLPHCIAVDNYIIRLFDPQCHQRVEGDQSHLVDHRWVRIKRPLIVVGGEMTIDSLDLAFHPSMRYYEAPLHVKANGGLFLIDDFGRQHIEPHELLNRWIVLLEHRMDFLTLHTGQKIQMPFLLMLIIATNLNPADVTDPAFLRRIGYRLQMPSPNEAQYRRIFEQYAARYNITVESALLDRLIICYRVKNRELRGCEPRDLIEHVVDLCRFRNEPLTINDHLLSLAWSGYFGEAPPSFK